MTGQIPPYGQNFRWERVSYHPDRASRIYVLKRDGRWFIRSDRTSKAWAVYFDPAGGFPFMMGKVWPSLTVAMAKLLDGIEQGFYPVAEPGTSQPITPVFSAPDTAPASRPHTSWCGLQGSGLDKSCTCQAGDARAALDRAREIAIATGRPLGGPY